ncbi:MAG: UbiX family flavin prenyltransferase [Pseudomonadota bacterium]
MTGTGGADRPGTGPGKARERLIVGLSGASGAILGIRLLEVLSDLDLEVHLVVSRSAEQTILAETSWKVDEVKALADVVHDFQDIGASIASGSFRALGMAVIPCSMKTLSALAHSYDDNLLVRAADVCLKERRRLVVVPRESPLHRGHMGLMAQVDSLGAMIVPPMMTFYHHPRKVEDLIDHLVGKVLNCFGIDNRLLGEWGGGRLQRPGPSA